MRPQDILVPTPAGVCCKLGGFHIDPTRPVDKALITHGHSDHARAGHGAVLATQETLDLMRLRYGENFAGSTQAVSYGETVRLDGVRVTFHPAGHVLGSAQIAVEANGLRIVASGDYKDVADPTCAPFELVPLRRLHHRSDVRPAGVPARRSGRRDRQAPAFGRAVSRARAPGRRLLARQGAARDRAHPQGRLRQADLSARRAREHHALLREPRHRARRLAQRARRRQGRARRRHRALSALGPEGAVVAPLPRSGDLVRLRLDAGARAGAPARRRAAAGHLRPRRLGRADRDRRGDRRRGGLGHPRPGGCAGALEREPRARGAAARHRRLRRRGRDRRHHCGSGRGRRGPSESDDA